MATDRHEELAAAAAFVDVCNGGDPHDLLAAGQKVSQCASPTAWRTTIRKVAREVSSVSPDMRLAFLGVWIGHKNMPNLVRDNVTMYAAARVLLPPYHGPAVRLYRGTAHRRRRRRVGVTSWTANMEIAEIFARQHAESGRDGVVFETMADPKAILCSVPDAGGAPDESEFIVELRYLAEVSIVRRLKSEST
ncbi:hypothetical protein ACWAT4_27440 [Bradyrhizobium manausense]